MGDNTACPRAALSLVPILPNVRSTATWQLVKAQYIAAVQRLAPAGASVRAAHGRAPYGVRVLACLRGDHLVTPRAVMAGCTALPYRRAAVRGQA